MSNSVDNRLRSGRLSSLLLRLLKSDSGEEVVAALQAAGFWDDDACWRLYGDSAKNYAAAGNQQRSPEAALVEKLINSVDACLMRRILEVGIDPMGEHAPRSIREAVAMFYEEAQRGSIRDHQGFIKHWTAQRRTEVAREITLSVTGPTASEGRPSITIADAGEGQLPDALPDTILSLEKGLKETIPFVQGKFNMGGTGVLRFCGSRNLQLILSKRSPVLAGPAPNKWGFTIVRREPPNEHRRISVYRYLAPVGADDSPNGGSVLTVDAPTLPIFPEGQNAYARKAEFGTLVKLYEYDTRFRTHMFRRGGLQERLDLLIPGLALPVRLHECRNYSGEARSFETTLAGLDVRLADSQNLESGFPDSGEIFVNGERIGVTIYAFKRGVARTYRRTEGVLFVVNGQTHSMLSDRFFRRKDVGMAYLADSLLVLLDCSDLSGLTKEELFLNSRDRLAEAELERRIEEELADVIFNHGALRTLREQRRQEDTAAKLGNSKPLEDALNQILKRSPSLSALFLTGTRLSNPFSTVDVTVGCKFVGKPHPTVFKFKDRPYGDLLERTCNLGQRIRLTFETDVVNDYFKRDMNPGRLLVDAVLNGSRVTVDHTLNLHDGFAHLNVHLPRDARRKDTLHLTVEVTDATLVESFVNQTELTVLAAQTNRSGGASIIKTREEEAENGRVEKRQSGIALPKIVEVTQDEWSTREMDAYSALRIVNAGLEEGDGEGRGQTPIYDFFVNVDNIYLKTEEKASPSKADVLSARFKFGMILVGLGVLRHCSQHQETDEDTLDENSVRTSEPEEFVAQATDAIGPMLLPMIEALGDLELDEPLVYGEQSGDGSEP